ncbi:MAG: polysaccharide deacetylase family protein [Ferruginibacter sp.]
MASNVSIIMYHYVRDLKHGPFNQIKGLDIEGFKGQIEYLGRHYKFITMDELIDSIDNNGDLPPKSILLSFDDGYFDHFNNVLPVLSKLKIQGSFYPPAKAILNNEVLDVNKIHFTLACVADKAILVEEIFKKLDEYRVQFRLENNEAYYQKHAVASRYDSAEVKFIKYMLQVILPEELRLIICHYLFNKYVSMDESGFSQQLYMNIVQLKELKDHGMHIGSHGYNHYWLGSLSPEKQQLEIKKSLEFLQQIGCDLNRWTMCYPYGSHNNDTINILRENHCKLALTTKINVSTPGKSNRFQLPRLDTTDVPIHADDLPNKWFAQA